MPPEGTEAEVAVIPEDFNLAKDIFRTFAKTVKAFGTYPKDNPIYRKFADELTQKFENFFNNRDTLDLHVGQFSLSYGGQDVFYSEERQGNISLLLYVDGIRQIIFHKGLTGYEIEEFINIMRVGPKEDNLEDDIVTLLWEKDLEHIGYFVPAEVGEGEGEIEDALTAMQDVEENVQARGSGSVAASGPGAAQLSFKTAPLSPDLLDSLRQEAYLLEGKDLIMTAAEFFLDRMTAEEDVALHAEYAKQLKRLFDFLMENNDVRGATEILRKLNDFGSTASAETRSHVEDVIAGAGSYENLKSVLKLAADQGLVEDYIGQLHAASALDMIKALGETDNRNVRRILFNTLALFVRDNIEPFVKALRDTRWFVVRNIVMIMGMSGDPAMAPHIKKTVQHPEIKVRREAVRSLSMLDTQESRKLLMSMLDDPDAGVRSLALKSVRRHGDEELYQSVLERIKREGFRDKTFDEKKELLEVLGETGRSKALKVLAEFFGKKSLFHREKVMEIKAAAAHGLAYVEDPSVTELLKGGLESKSSLLRNACLAALKRKASHEKA